MRGDLLLLLDQPVHPGGSGAGAVIDRARSAARNLPVVAEVLGADGVGGGALPVFQVTESLNGEVSNAATPGKIEAGRSDCWAGGRAPTIRPGHRNGSRSRFRTEC